MTECACGCKMAFEPRRTNHIYADGHLKINRGTVVMRIPRKDASRIRSRMAPRDERRSSVHTIVGPESEGLMLYRLAVHQAALWLAKRYR